MSAEGMRVKNPEEIILPTTTRFTDADLAKLKNIRIKKGGGYRKDGGKRDLELPHNPRFKKIIVDYYPKIQAHLASEIKDESETGEKSTTHLRAEHLAFLDYDKIYFDLQKFKNEREWFNLNITKEKIEKILTNHEWYGLLIPEEQLKFNSVDKIELWQDIANNLIRKYCDRFYKYCKNEWEASRREYAPLNKSDPNFIKQYRILLYKSSKDVIKRLEGVKNALENDDLSAFDYENPIKHIHFEQHLYQPLLYSRDSDIQIKPVPLNEGERKFIDDLQYFYALEKKGMLLGKEIYLIRNMSRGHGVGFFEAGNFYPDFILWIIDGGKQYIFFIDPKGLHHISGGDPKLSFHTIIKDVEAQLNDKQITLNSFIISSTPQDDVFLYYEDEDEKKIAEKHILFRNNSRSYIGKMFKTVM